MSSKIRRQDWIFWLFGVDTFGGAMYILRWMIGEDSTERHTPKVNKAKTLSEAELF